MTRLVLAALLLWPSPAETMTVRCEHGRSCSGSITFTGTIVAATSMQAEAHDGVLVVHWQTSGSSDAVEGERWALYDRDVMAVNLTLTPDGEVTGHSLGGTLAWIGTSEGADIIAADAHK